MPGSGHEPPPTGTCNVVSGNARALVQAGTVRDININFTDGPPAEPGRPVTTIPETRNVVPRPDLTEPLIGRLSGRRTGGVVALTAVAGAGGFGKTTLASEICHDSRIVERFSDGVLWVTIGEHTAGAELAVKINDLILQLSARRSLFTDPEQAGRHLGQLLADRVCLLVVDDVWRASQLAPLLIGGENCVRLVTTRIKDSLPAGVDPILVDAMTGTQARDLLGANLPGAVAGKLEPLLAHTGNWPVLLALANRALGKYVQRGLAVADAAARLADRLTTQGPAAFDINDIGQRNLAVAATVEASLSLLENGGADRLRRYLELAVFPEDVAIPQGILENYWARTGDLNAAEVEQLCSELDDLCLVQGYRLAPKAELSLHDVIRSYLRHRVGPDVAGLHRELLDAHRPEPLADGSPVGTTWWRLPAEEGYLWEHLGYHLEQSGLLEELNATACDFRWIMAALKNVGPDGVDTFLGVASDPVAVALRHALKQSSHLFFPFRPESELGPTVLSRLAGYAELEEYAEHWSTVSDRLHLFPDWPLPDMPDRSLRRALYNDKCHLVAVAMSPDGTWFAVAPADSTIKLINVNGTERCVLRGHAELVCDLAISPDGSWLASAGMDGTVRLWASDGTALGVLGGHGGGVYAVAISPDGAWLATGGRDGTIRLWQPDGTELGLLRGHGGGVHAVAISPDGAWFATGGRDGTIRLWHSDGTERALLEGHEGTVNAVAISPDGSWLATGGTDNVVRLWEVDGRKRQVLKGHEGWVYGVVIGPDGQWLASCGDDCSVRLWSTGGMELQVLHGHTDLVRDLAISPDGRELISVGDDHSIRFWRDYDAAAATPVDARGVITSIGIDPTGSWLATTGHSNTIRLRRADGSLRKTVKAGEDWVTSITISSDGSWLAGVGADSKVHLLAADGFECGALAGHEVGTWVAAIAISPDGNWLASGGEDTTVRLWNFDGTARACLTGHHQYVTSLSISPDGAWLASGDGGAVIRLWDSQGAERHVLRGHREWIDALAISPDSSWLASASRDGTIRVWSADGVELGVLEGHGDWVNDVAISPDGRLIASCSSDRTIRLWSSGTLSCVAALRTESALDCLAWFPSGDRIAVGGRLGPYVFRLVR